MRKLLTALILVLGLGLYASGPGPKDTTRFVMQPNVNNGKTIFDLVFTGFAYKNFGDLVYFSDSIVEYVTVRGKNYSSECMRSDTAMAKLNKIFQNLNYCCFREIPDIGEDGDATIYVRVQIFPDNEKYVMHVMFVLDRLRAIKMILVE